MHHDCEHTTYEHGADGCRVPGCLCAFMSWAEDDYEDDGPDLATELAERGLRACCGLPGEIHCR